MTFNRKKKVWKQRLLDYRNKRQRPRLDDKTLVSWNGLMMKGYIDAYKAFQQPEYLNTAIQNAKFMWDHLRKEDGGLYHTFKAGKSSINGYLEDYSAMIEAYLALYEVTLDASWLNRSKELADYAIANFLDEENQMFFFTSKQDAEIVTRTIEYRDNVIPASNSMMAKNLFVLSHHFDEETYRDLSLQMLKNVQQEFEQYPGGFSNWLDLLEHHRDKYYEIVVVGDEALSRIEELNKLYIPGKLIAGSTGPGALPLLKGRHLEGKTFIYVCVNNTCKLPVTTTEEALQLL